MAQELVEARGTLADEWAAASPRTPEQIAAFYRDSEAMRADLTAWHAEPAREAMTARIASLAAQRNVRRVLDVGAGLGHDLRAIRAAVPGVVCEAVEPNVGMHFALTDDGFTVATDIEHVNGEFDLIVCIDVLEHVSDPEALLGAMIDRLAPDGVLIERAATFDHGTPLHLEANHGWSPDATLVNSGFVVYARAHETVWERGPAVPTALLCAYRSLSIETAEALAALTDRGWFQSIHRGDALITRVRSKAVSHWFRDVAGSDVFLMIDDDVVFRPEDAERVVEIAREQRGIACGAYPVHDGRHLACRALSPGEEIHFGNDLPPKEILWAATGFMAVHRDVVAQMVESMPLCEDRSVPWWPLFDTAFVRSDGEFIEDPTQAAGERVVGLSEDYAFCERARQLGFKVWLDPQTVLLHMGQTAYSVLNMKESLS